MTALQLNYDCIHNILRFLQNHRSTLYDCLLVNHFWCETIIPLLYANPFANLNNKSQCLILNTFLSFLNEKERNYLLKSELNLKNNSKTLFEYPKYIRQLIDTEIFDATKTWYSYSWQRVNPYVKETFYTFYHMFLRQGICIKHLEIDSSTFSHSIYDDVQFIDAFNFSKLTTLHLHTKRHERFSKFLQTFVKHCKNLNRLSFSQLNNSDEIASIIRQQYKLKELTVIESPNNIFSSLEFQKNSLMSLKLHSVSIQNYILQSIIKLHNLKLFEINSCTLKDYEIFKFASFKLKELSIRNNWIMPQIIKYLGINLQRLKIDHMNTEIMEAIAQYSLDLETLDIYSSKFYMIYYLKNLKIKNLNMHLHNYIDFIKLAENLSENTIKVSFISFMSEQDLLIFLNNCPSHIITLNFSEKFRLGHLKIILNYVEKMNNNLKYLGISDLNESWSIDELDLLNQIRERGISLMEFNDSYKESDYSFLD